jgi:hypothetical protein
MIRLPVLVHHHGQAAWMKHASAPRNMAQPKAAA